MTKHLILLIAYVSYCLSNALWIAAETQVHGWYLMQSRPSFTVVRMPSAMSMAE